MRKSLCKLIILYSNNNKYIYIFHYCFVEDLCSDSPCKNEGTCFLNGSTVMCNCTASWSGVNCTQGMH